MHVHAHAYTYTHTHERYKNITKIKKFQGKHSFGLLFQNNTVWHGGEGVMAEAGGWLVTVHPHLGSRKWIGRSRARDFEA